MKRFYKLVSSRPEGAGHAVLLDGRPVKTPGRRALIAPTPELAKAIVFEWAAQKEKIIPADMPLTQILSTKIDRVAVERAAMEKAILAYLDTDLICYRAPAPPELVRMQAEAWDKWLSWFEAKSGTALETTEGLDALRQPSRAHEAARVFVEGLDNDHFTVLQIAASFAGSLVLAMAFAAGEAGAGEIFACARIEERHKAQIYDESRYGPDPAQQKKDEAALRDLRAAEKFLALLK